MRLNGKYRYMYQLQASKYFDIGSSIEDIAT